jgi:hypothetical protein
MCIRLNLVFLSEDLIRTMHFDLSEVILGAGGSLSCSVFLQLRRIGY